MGVMIPFSRIQEKYGQEGGSVREKLLMTRIEAALKKREYAYRLIEEADAELVKCAAELKREEEKNAGDGT